MEAQRSQISPRIRLLQQALLSGNTAALGTFWQEIMAEGAPLLEAIEGDPDHHLVTFLWRERAETQKVVVWGGPAGLDHPEKNQMTRLLDTDLWYRTYRVETDLRGVYSFTVDDALSKADEKAASTSRRYLTDPLNPKLTTDLSLSLFELPGAPAQLWILPQPDAKKGQVELHHLRSQILGNERRAWVYTPADYTRNGAPYGLLLLFDGARCINQIPVPTILDNLVHAGKIVPLVAVLLDSVDQATRNRELFLYPPFVDFLTQELIPWVHEHYHVTHDPAQTIVGGGSGGGLAAAFAGLRASATFGDVLSQSGSFWWGSNRDPEASEETHLPQEWIIQQFLTSPRLPLRFSFEVGLKEDWGWMHMATANRHLRDVLKLKGYEVDYAEFNGYHVCECWRGTFADRLIALVGKKESFTMSHTPFTPIIIPDVCYGTTDDGKPLLLDIMRPEPLPENRMPVVVQIHGGGWCQGGREPEHNRFFAEQGFFTISIGYRLSGEATFPAQIEDIKMAVRWLREHAEEYHLDPERIGVWGHSAGGHLSALLGTSGDRQTPEDAPVVERYSVQVQAVATLAGPADLIRIGEWNPDPNSCESQLLGGPVLERRELARNASPVAFVNRAMPPFLIIHGTHDDLVPFQQAVLLYEALKAVGADVTFVPVEGGHNLHDDWRIEVREVLAFFQKKLCSIG